MLGGKGQSSKYPFVAKKHVGDYKHFAGKAIHQTPHTLKANVLGVYHDSVKKTNSLEKAK
jgi:hypothetical protein